MKLYQKIAFVLIAATLALGCDRRHEDAGSGKTNSATNAQTNVANVAEESGVAAPRAEQDVSLSRTATPSQAPTPDHYVVCGFYYDISPSVDARVERAAGAALSASLESFIQRYGCSEIRFASFAEEGAFLMPQRVVLLTVDSKVDCDEHSSTKNRVLGFLPGAAGAAEGQCKDLRKALERRAIQTRKTELMVVRNFLTTELPRRGECTNLAGLFRMLDRSRSRADIDIIFSDGVESCVSELPEIAVHHRILIVQCPRSGDLRATGPEALARAGSLEQQIGGLGVLLPSEISAELWKQVDEPGAEPVPDRQRMLPNGSPGVRSSKSSLLAIKN